MIGHLRRIAHRAASAWIATLDAIRGTAREVMRAILSFVDSRTGASHPRFPITIERIAREVGRDASTVCRALGRIEDEGFVVRRRMRPRRQHDGTVRQDPTDYELVLPDECWRELAPVESTPAARGPAQPVASDPSWSRSVRGSLSERITKRDLPISRGWKLDPSVNSTFIDDMHVDKLAPLLVDAAMLSAEGTDESLRHRTIVCLDELRKRAHDVALLACNLDLSSWDAKSCMRHWVARCLANAEQKIESADHAMNILRKFFIEQAEWFHRKAARRIEERTRAKYRRLDDERETREQSAERERMREARAHIAIGYDRGVVNVGDGSELPDFGYGDADLC